VISSLGFLFTSHNGLIAFILQVINGLLFGWVLWAVIAYFVGSSVYGGKSSPSKMMRALAYASAPRVLGLFAFIPCVGWILSFAGWLLSIVAGVIAIRESMEFDTNKAVVTAIIGFFLYIIASIVIGMTIGVLTIPLH